VKQDLKEFKAQLARLGLRVHRDQLDLVASLVKMESVALRALQAQLEHRAQQVLKVSRGKLAPEEQLVRKAIGASLALQERLGQQDLKDSEEQQEQQALRALRELKASEDPMDLEEPRVTEV
jgi:hypothetical protein